MRFPQPVKKTVPLMKMPGGRPFLVEELVGSPSVRSRLYAMGILPGTELERSSDGDCDGGTVCVRVRQSTLVLDEKLARSVYCRPPDVR